MNDARPTVVAAPRCFKYKSFTSSHQLTATTADAVQARGPHPRDDSCRSKSPRRITRRRARTLPASILIVPEQFFHELHLTPVRRATFTVTNGTDTDVFPPQSIARDRDQRPSWLWSRKSEGAVVPIGDDTAQWALTDARSLRYMHHETLRAS